MTARDPNWAFAKGIGDIDSEERGSGARFNDGKPAMELLPLSAVAELLSIDYGSESDEVRCLRHLGKFQATGDKRHLFDAMEAVGDPLITLAECARVFDYGKRKYAEWNWAKGMAWSIPLACAVRHLLAMIGGERIDPVDQKGSGLPHRGHVMCNLMMLALYSETFPEGNDLPIKWMSAPNAK